MFSRKGSKRKFVARVFVEFARIDLLSWRRGLIRSYSRMIEEQCGSKLRVLLPESFGVAGLGLVFIFEM